MAVPPEVPPLWLEPSSMVVAIPGSTHPHGGESCPAHSVLMQRQTQQPLVAAPLAEENSLARVMSPTLSSTSTTDRWGHPGITLPCDICAKPAHEPWICSACSKTGHLECLQAAQIEGYAFCSTCWPWALDQHSRCTTDALKARWNILKISNGQDRKSS